MALIERGDALDDISHINSLRDPEIKPPDAALNVGPLRKLPLVRSLVRTWNITFGTEGRAGVLLQSMVLAFVSCSFSSDGTNTDIGLT